MLGLTHLEKPQEAKIPYLRGSHNKHGKQYMTINELICIR